MLNKSVLCRCGCYGRCTFEPIWVVLAWSFQALLTGRFPKRDHEGHVFKDPWRRAMAGKRLPVAAACLAKCGDWSWFKQALNLCGWRGETADKHMCWLCGAGFNCKMNCYDARINANWRSSMVSNAEYLLHSMNQNKYVCGIWSIPGFVLRYCRPDWMHCCDLGITQDVSGNCMYELLQELGGSQSNGQKQCSQLMNMIAVASKELRVDKPFNKLTVGMVVRAGKPKLRLKAAETRHFIPVLMFMLNHFFKNDSDHSRLRLQCVAALSNCYRELDNWVQSESQISLARFARQHVMLYSELSKAATDAKKWQLYPKHHLFLHVCEQARVCPKAEWNYSDEDEIGTAVKFGKGAHVAHLCTSLLAKHRDCF